MKKNNYVKIVFRITAALSLIGSIFISFGWPFFQFITYAGKKENNSSSSNRKKWFSLKHTRINHPSYKHGDEYVATKNWCNKQDMEDWYTESLDGLKLHASYLPCDEPKRFVILCHGYRGTRFGSVAHIAQTLHDENCSLLFIDQRCCGESEGKYITFGAKEQYDVIQWIKQIHGINEKKLPIYLYGQSMGATSVLLASGHALPQEVRGIIADCGFHSMNQQMKDIASGWFHLKRIGLLLFRVDLFCHIFAGFSMKDTDVTTAMKYNEKPVLFFHGEDDTYVWPENTLINYRLCTASKELVLVPKSRHLCCSYDTPVLYKEKVLEFFNKYDNGI